MTVTRFPPSPTGDLHIGGARTALYSWLYARQHDGKFILRIEDTDLERNSQKSVDAIIDGMNWLGLDYDEGPIFQTDRFDRYKEMIQQLLDEDKAYYCDCICHCCSGSLSVYILCVLCLTPVTKTFTEFSAKYNVSPVARLRQSVTRYTFLRKAF